MVIYDDLYALSAIIKRLAHCLPSTHRAIDDDVFLIDQLLRFRREPPKAASAFAPERA